MKKPTPIVAAATNDRQIEQMIEGLSVPQLNNLIALAETIRDGKLANAKREFLERMRAEARTLGINLDEIATTSKPKAAAPAAEMPRNWRERVISCLQKNEGRATGVVIHRDVWPNGNSGYGSGTRLRAYLLQMVDEGVLILLRPGGDGVKPLYGLASMIEKPEENAA